MDLVTVDDIRAAAARVDRWWSARRCWSRWPTRGCGSSRRVSSRPVPSSCAAPPTRCCAVRCGPRGRRHHRLVRQPRAGSGLHRPPPRHPMRRGDAGGRPAIQDRRGTVAGRRGHPGPAGRAAEPVRQVAAERGLVAGAALRPSGHHRGAGHDRAGDPRRPARPRRAFWSRSAAVASRPEWPAPSRVWIRPYG